MALENVSSHPTSAAFPTTPMQAFPIIKTGIWDVRSSHYGLQLPKMQFCVVREKVGLVLFQSLVIANLDGKLWYSRDGVHICLS